MFVPPSHIIQHHLLQVVYMNCQIFISSNNLSSSQSHFTLFVTSHTEPKTYEEAIQYECWVEAMNTEIFSLVKNGTWTLVELPPKIKPIGSKWVFKVKYHSDGTIERYKARLVAKGYSWIEGLDYCETFSPVAKMTTVRMFLALPSINNWFLHQLDVNNAFLHGDLHEDVYMESLQGVQSSKPNQVCRLNKSLYGLKQASRKLYEKLAIFLTQQGYVQVSTDHTLFIHASNDTFTALLVYVDDIILAGNSLTEIIRIKSLLVTVLKSKILVNSNIFLALKFHTLIWEFLYHRESIVWTFSMILVYWALNLLLHLWIHLSSCTMIGANLMKILTHTEDL